MPPHPVYDSVPVFFSLVEAQGARMLIRRGYEPYAGYLGLAGTPLTSAEYVEGGRQAHPVVMLPDGGRAVVRTYRRGGALRHVNPSRYFLGHRAFAELRATEQAANGGARVPRVLAATERSHSLGYTATLATEWIADAQEVATWLLGASQEARIAALREAGRQIEQVHDAGVGHPDLNLRNLLVRERRNDEQDGGGEEHGPVVYVLDFDRAKLYRGPAPRRRRARDLRRLARSARKLRAPIGTAEWSAMRSGYGSAWPLPDLG
jgi:3-deoxy-D-manno-octulosonic acid kinase